jgi:hypothetical protein
MMFAFCNKVIEQIWTPQVMKYAYIISVNILICDH